MDPVKAARAGDEAAFLRIFNEHRQPLFAFAYRLTASRGDAEDIVQDAFMELLRRGCGYDASRAPLRTFLLGIVRNQALKRFRKRGIAVEREDDPSPELEYLTGEAAEAVERAVMQLPETQRAVVLLAHYEQLPLAEIAELMNLDIGAVKSRLQRGRGALKQILVAYAPGVEGRR